MPHLFNMLYFTMESLTDINQIDIRKIVTLCPSDKSIGNVSIIPVWSSNSPDSTCALTWFLITFFFFIFSPLIKQRGIFRSASYCASVDPLWNFLEQEIRYYWYIETASRAGFNVQTNLLGRRPEKREGNKLMTSRQLLAALWGDCWVMILKKSLL